MTTAVDKSNAYFELVSEVCKQAMTAAAEKPGRYGGRYIARRYNRAERRDDVFILDDDDPDLYRDDETLDILAQVTPKAVLPIGRCRYWLNSDGSIDWGYFGIEAPKDVPVHRREVQDQIDRAAADAARRPAARRVSARKEASGMIVWDIETGPLSTHELLDRCPPFEAPPHPGEFDPAAIKYGNTKDADKRAAILSAAREKHAAAVASYTQDVETARRDHFAKFCERAALDPTTGRVLAIGFLAADKGGKIVTDDDADEGSLINRFWMQYSRCRESNRRMVGLNIYGFDLPFLIRRSWILDVPVPLTVFDGRYFDRLFIDIQQVWLCGQRWGNGCESSLAAISRAFGVGEKNGNGADFAKLLVEDREAALGYLRNDLELTAKCAARMGVV